VAELAQDGRGAEAVEHADGALRAHGQPPPRVADGVQLGLEADGARIGDETARRQRDVVGGAVDPDAEAGAVGERQRRADRVKQVGLDRHERAPGTQQAARLGDARRERAAVGDVMQHEPVQDDVERCVGQLVELPGGALQPLVGLALRHGMARALRIDVGGDEALQGAAGQLDELPDGSFDVVLHRLVLHHVAYSGALAPCIAEARRLLRPGGALVAIEPNLFHPIGAALALANRAGFGVRVHGTPDDIPLSPRRLAAEARAAGLEPELHAVSYSWRRLPVRAQRAVGALDRFGSAPFLRELGHTFMLIARRPAGSAS